MLYVILDGGKKILGMLQNCGEVCKTYIWYNSLRKFTAFFFCIYNNYIL